MLDIKLLGQFDVRLNEQPVELASRRAQSLLAYLALNAGTAHRREELAGLFWPNSAEKNARNRLRQELWRIRQAIEPYGSRRHLNVDDISIAFDAASDWCLDVAILQRNVGQNASADDWIESLAVYRGVLLPGFYDEWVLLERERLQATFERKIARLIELLLEEQQWTHVLDWSERWIALGQAPEPAYRALMVAHRALGDQSQVALVFERCVRALRSELGVAPSEQTRLLFKQLSSSVAVPFATHSPLQVSTSLAPLSGKEPSVPLSAPRPAPFVAREYELARLDVFLGKALAGQGQVIFITGEAGSGKTALSREFARHAQMAHPDLIVATGACDAHSGMGVPYQPFREMLGLLTGDVEARWTGELITRESARRLWVFKRFSVPALVEQGPDLVDDFVSGTALVTRSATCAPDGTGWFERLKELAARPVKRTGSIPPEPSHILEQYTRVLQYMATQQPLVLILDDLHWADASSLNLLFHLGQRIATSRMLIVGSYRPEDIAHDWEGKPHPLQELLSEFKRRFGDIWVDLNRATVVKGRRFVDALLDTEPNRLGETFRRKLFQHTEGHALFTVELLREMHERGDLTQDSEGQWIEGRTLDWETLPTRVEGVIEKRIDRLPAELRRALSVASVEGEEFTAEVVARVEALDEQALVRRLGSELDRRHHLVGAESIRWLGTQQLSRYRFRHYMFQQYLYHTLDEAERAYLHTQVGSALESLYGDEKEQIAMRVVWHLQAAGIAK